ncbi:MAG: ABC transporter permease [Lutibacter sp.]|jgi:putative ABC transport system permease protein|nr:ABC transporter permease [Lutibacter sp.]
MFDLDRWQEIFLTLRKNKLRTALSGFTIAFAILLFTLLFGIGNGLKHTFENEFKDDAANAIFIYSGKTTKPYRGLQSGRRIQLKNDDYQMVLDAFDGKVQYLSARVYKGVQATYKGEQNSYEVRAVHPDHQFLERTEIDEGRFINQSDLSARAKVIVIGKLVREDLFGQRNAIGKVINLSGIAYTIVGVFSDDGGDNEERFIYMPVSTAQFVYGNTDHINQLNLSYNPAMDLEEAIAFGNTLLSRFKDKHDIAPRDQSAIRINNLAEANKGVNQFMTALNLIILFIGLGTLVAGIIGISNIMVYIVRERTKELGIRKALGATPRSIIGMIMLESVFVTSIAGYIGLLLGVLSLRAIGDSLEAYWIVDPSVENYVIVGATIILIIAGTLAGFLPAKRAAGIKPIEALNDE